MEIMILKCGCCFLLGFWISSIIDENEVKTARRDAKDVDTLRAKAYRNGYIAGKTAMDFDMKGK